MPKPLALESDKKTPVTEKMMSRLKKELEEQVKDDEKETKNVKQTKSRAVLPKQTPSRHELKMNLMRRGESRESWRMFSFLKVLLLSFLNPYLHYTVILLIWLTTACALSPENFAKDSKHDLIFMERQKAVLEVDCLAVTSQISVTVESCQQSRSFSVLPCTVKLPEASSDALSSWSTTIIFWGKNMFILINPKAWFEAVREALCSPWCHLIISPNYFKYSCKQAGLTGPEFFTDLGLHIYKTAVLNILQYLI